MCAITPQDFMKIATPQMFSLYYPDIPLQEDL